MNALIANIQANMGSLLRYEACLPQVEIKIGDTLRPYSDVFPGSSSSSPEKIMQNGNEEYIERVHHEHRQNMNPHLQSPRFSPMQKRSRAPFESRKASTPPPFHISHRMWLGISAIIRYYEGKGIDISPYLEKTLDEEGLIELIKPLDEECKQRGAWPIYTQEYMSKMSIRDERIDLNLPFCYCEDQNAHLIEMFFFGFRDYFLDYIENSIFEEEQLDAYFSPEDKALIEEVGWEKILDVYVDSKSEKRTFKLEVLEGWRDRLFSLSDDHPVLAALSPEIITEHEVFFSLQEASDITAYLEYSESFSKVVDEMPEFALDYSYGDDGYIMFLNHLIEIYRLETGQVAQSKRSDDTSPPNKERS